jgi:ribonuclease BN (tRNA processing enzyme)
MREFELKIIGDSGPFSRLGKSIGYHLTYGDASYLLDCGAPVFQILGQNGLKELDGIIATHAHEDHKRWFTDIALYQKFSLDRDDRITLIGTHEIIRQYRLASPAALERTLNYKSNNLRSLRFEDYIEPQYIGPEPKYKIKKLSDGNGSFQWRVVDQSNDPLPPDRAKVIKPAEAIIPSMIIKDEKDGVWVEPNSYYSLDDSRFYDTDGSVSSYDLGKNFSLKPYRAPAWHGPSTTAFSISLPEGEIFFTSDTVYNPTLWDELTEPRDSRLSRDELDRSYIEGAVEDYIECVWSEKRLERAKSVYEKDCIYIHDVSGPDAKVHTAYKHLKDFDSEMLLTHSPDVFTTKHPMAHLNKTYTLRDNQLLERTKDGELYPLDAVCYFKKFSQYYVGYKDPDGDFILVEKSPGDFGIDYEEAEVAPDTTVICRISLYRDLGGRYFPTLKHENEEYRTRPDGQVERIVNHSNGSKGDIMEDSRRSLSSDAT